MRELGDSHSPRCGQAAAMNLDPFQQMECIGSQIAVAAVRTDQYGRVLDDEERRPRP